MKTIFFTIFIILLLSVTSVYASESNSSKANKVYVDVNGLVCDFCARALEKVFKKEDAVNSIEVNLDKKYVEININKNQSLSEGRIKELINNAGYNIRAIRYE